MKKHSKTHITLLRLVFSALCLSLCILLPFVTGQIPRIGSMLCPMHIPVLLAGFICGPFWAMAVGLLAPLLRFALFGMPPLLPTGLAMCFELFTYGLVSGFLFRALPGKPAFVYLSLVGAMLSGRIVWGMVSSLIYGAMGSPFTWQVFFAGAFVNALPGIVLHILIIPPIVMALQKARLIER